MNQVAVNLLSQKVISGSQPPPPAENAISSEDDSSDGGRRGSGEKEGYSPNVDPDIAAYIKEHFNDQLSDDEDNSWADELSEHGIDDYYGEEGDDAEYGDENSPVRGGLDASPTIENSVCVDAEDKEEPE